ncbi:hypothetical protein MNBD_GAMMA12-1011 [hydrothermal vent metagenome]|uniref:FHA domain-containing protein n=1 Tax=hydrothermal vent metagenome TaxID=652676 RepID=A0A3B0Z1P6_9ZZZZ
MIKLTLQFKGKSLKVYPVKNQLMKIGRDSACDITIDNLALSPLHAIIEVDNNNLTIIDKSEKTEEAGVIVNANKVKQHKLDHNDVVYLGKYALKVTHEETTESVVNDSSMLPLQPLPEETFIKSEKIQQGWLQIMSGPKLGRTIKLENSMVRIGKSGKTSAMITCREGKYYIAHLEGEPKTQVAQREIGDKQITLSDGDMLNIGTTQMLFFLE